RPRLRDALLLARRFPDDSAFGNRVSEWFFAVNVPSALERSHRNDGMRVVWCADDNCVDAFLIKQAAKIVIPLRAGIFLGGSVEEFVVHIAKRDDVLAGDLAQVPPSLVRGADHPDIEFFRDLLLAEPR